MGGTQTLQRFCDNVETLALLATKFNTEQEKEFVVGQPELIAKLYPVARVKHLVINSVWDDFDALFAENRTALYAISHPPTWRNQGQLRFRVRGAFFLKQNRGQGLNVWQELKAAFTT